MNEEKIWSKDFTGITVSHAFYALAVYMLVPTIPLLLVSLGATESQVGVVVTAYYVSSILTRLLVNAVIEKTGKKRVLIAGFLLSAIVMALYGFVESTGAITALRVIQGVGHGMSAAIATTMAVDFLPDSRRGQGVGYFSMGMIVAMSIAPAIALQLKGSYGFRIMFLAAAGINFIAAVMVFFISEPVIVRAKPKEKREGRLKNLDWRNMYDRRLIIPSVIILLFGICRSVDMNYISLFAEERNLAYLSWYFVIQTATTFLVRLVMGKFADRKGRDWVLIPGGFAMLAALVTLSFAETSGIMLLGAFLSGLGLGVLAPNLQVWVFGIVEPEKRSVAGATHYSVVDIGSALGAPLMGLAAENFGYPVMFRAGAFAALLYIVVYAAIGREKKARS